MFVANAVLNEKDVIESIDFLKENINEEIDYFTIPHTRALQTVENEGVSIIKYAQSSGLRKHTYKKISNVMQNFVTKVDAQLFSWKNDNCRLSLKNSVAVTNLLESIVVN